MKKTILLIYSNYSTFVAADHKLLKEKYHVLTYEFKSKKNLLFMFFELLKQLVFIIKHVRKIDVIFSWFSDFHSLIPFLIGKVFNKKNIVVVGGFDAVSIPELNYGLFHKKNLRYFFGKWSYMLSEIILPVDESLIESMNYYANTNGIKVGVKSYIPNVKAKFKSIPTGYYPDNWISENSDRSKSVMAFGFAANEQKFVGKGYDFLIEVAAKMPDVNFYLFSIQGKMKTYAHSIAPVNVHIGEDLTQEQLKAELTKHKVYALLSMSEGMPSSLCEAMLSGCVPVGSNVGGIKNVIGDCGFLLKNKNVDEAVILINEALEVSNDFAAKGRELIRSKFHMNKRQQELYSILEFKDYE
ncbi:MAG: glycosyltransferase family 4 protein [Salinivirgaceae bacterium]|nr:glycosyltransferase family 4 protein [Salinivirgaceae bacterium]